MQWNNYKALMLGQRAGLLAAVTLAASSFNCANASDIDTREAYFKASTGRALEVLVDAKPSNKSAFTWRKNKLDISYVSTLAALQFGMPRLASEQSKRSGSASGELVRIALAESQYAAGNYAAAGNTLAAGNYAKGIEQAQAQYLRGQLYIATSDIDGAQKLFKKWKGNDPLKAYLGLNIGIWFAGKNNLSEAAQWLAKTAAMPLPITEEWASLKDRANVYLGGVYNWQGKPAMARKALEKVRLSGVDANRALLSLGWTDTARSQSKEALAPWTYLSGQSQSDVSVQESYLLVPFALGRLGAHGKASNVFNKAIRIYGQELALLNKAKAQSANGELLKRISKTHQSSITGWESSMASAAGAQLSVYLIEALKREELYKLFKNYMEIEDMRRMMVATKSVNRTGARTLLVNMQSLQQAYARLINQALQQELTAQIKRLKEYQSHANFSLAESYERVADSNAWEQ